MKILSLHVLLKHDEVRVRGLRVEKDNQKTSPMFFHLLRLRMIMYLPVHPSNCSYISKHCAA
ncbi:MAG: hypothetical protein PHU66_10450, partial [Bacteroidaceae bacterium]|nr:hypothetical protein [Bacteroidaceae bacterium]